MSRGLGDVYKRQEQALANAGVGVVMEDEAVEDVVGSIRWKIQ